MSNLTLTQYFIALLATGIINGSLGLFVILKGFNKRLNQVLAFYSFSLFLWSIFEALAITRYNGSLALLLWRINHIGVIFIPVFLTHFTFIFLDIKGKKRKLIPISYAVACIFLILNATPLLILEVVPKFSFRYFINPGRLYYIFFWMWIGWAIYGNVELFREYFKTSGYKRNQMQYFFWSLLFSYIGGVPNFFPTFNIEIPILMPFGTYAIPFYALATAYAILRYRFMDIKIVFTRAGIFILVYALVLGIPFALGYKYSQWQLATWVTVFLATFGPFLYTYLRREAEKRFRSEERLYQKALLDISSTMMLIKNLDRLLKTIVLKVVDLVKVSWAAVYLKDEKTGNYLLKHQRIPEAGITLPKEFSPDASFIKRLYQSKLPLIGEELNFSLEEKVPLLKAGLAVSCFLDNRMVGFLLLGDKPKNRIYTIEDTNTFAFLSNQTALAIENCQFHLQQRDHHHLLRVASLDRQMACMAHEIDNPNHALLGSLGSLELSLDELKENIPPDKLAYLKQKIERIRFNSARISKMISAVRNFSKTDTGELSPVKFEWIIEGFFNILEPQLKYYGVTYTQSLLDETIWLRASKLELEQVLVNLGTNSVQAINEVWQAGQNTPQSKKEILFIAAKKDANTLKISISDIGSGIKKELLEDIFLDFVTTKASSVGTGLGLAISRKIIQKHNGKIWAESEGENRGAAFYIELPIPQDITEEEKQEAERQYRDKDNKIIF